MGIRPLVNAISSTLELRHGKVDGFAPLFTNSLLTNAFQMVDRNEWIAAIKQIGNADASLAESVENEDESMGEVGGEDQGDENDEEDEESDSS